MLDNLWSTIEYLFLESKPIIFINELEGGILLRAGKYSRTLKTGAVLRIPFLDTIETTSLAECTIDLPTQSITTEDGKDLVIGGVLRYRVRDPKPYLLLVDDPISVIKDTVMGHVFDAIADLTFEEIRSKRKLIAEEISYYVSTAVYRYGIDIDVEKGFTFSDLAKTRNIRLLQDLAYKGSDFEEA